MKQDLLTRNLQYNKKQAPTKKWIYLPNVEFG